VSISIRDCNIDRCIYSYSYIFFNWNRSAYTVQYLYCIPLPTCVMKCMLHFRLDIDTWQTRAITKCWLKHAVRQRTRQKAESLVKQIATYLGYNSSHQNKSKKCWSNHYDMNINEKVGERKKQRLALILHFKGKLEDFWVILKMINNRSGGL
jgi:hypothetical protein